MSASRIEEGPAQRDDAKALRVGGGHEPRAGIGHRRRAGFREQAQVAALAQRREERVHVGVARVLVEHGKSRGRHGPRMPARRRGSGARSSRSRPRSRAMPRTRAMTGRGKHVLRAGVLGQGDGDEVERGGLAHGTVDALAAQHRGQRDERQAHQRGRVVAAQAARAGRCRGPRSWRCRRSRRRARGRGSARSPRRRGRGTPTSVGTIASWTPAAGEQAQRRCGRRRCARSWREAGRAHSRGCPACRGAAVELGDLVRADDPGAGEACARRLGLERGPGGGPFRRMIPRARGASSTSGDHDSKARPSRPQELARGTGSPTQGREKSLSNQYIVDVIQANSIMDRIMDRPAIHRSRAPEREGYRVRGRDSPGRPGEPRRRARLARTGSCATRSRPAWTVSAGR